MSTGVLIKWGRGTTAVQPLLTVTFPAPNGGLFCCSKPIDADDEGLLDPLCVLASSAQLIL